MDLLAYLLQTFGYNEPIFSGEISFHNYSRPWLHKELATLCEAGQLVRFEKGVYYVPKNTLLGPTKLSPQKVINKKYIADGGEQNGYYAGVSFLNQTGLSMQVPNVIEIYTNNEKAKVREVTVGTVRVLLRKSRVPVDKDNVGVQSFLELMNSVSPSFFDEERKIITTEYIKKYRISRRDITKYASAFPDKAMRTLIESEMIYRVAQ